MVSTWLTALRRRLQPTPQRRGDPVLGLLAGELLLAAAALESAAVAMKHQRVTPMTINATKLAATRARAFVEQIQRPRGER